MSRIFQFSYSLLRPFYERSSLHRGVIDEVRDKDLKRSYEHCRSITRRHAKTFYMAARMLPREKQRGIFAIYGLCRYLDDLVDEATDLITMKKISIDEVQDKLDQFREDLIDTYRWGNRNDPVLTAFADLLKRYRISIHLPLELMQGVRADLEERRFQNFEELYNYCWKVASVVGLMTCEVFGYKDKAALKHAADLGVAMQLTNILRDIGEDLRHGRLYLPLEELEVFRVSEEQLFEAHIDRNFIQLMRFQITRARQYYLSADKGIPMLHADSRLTVCLARENYSRILDKIEENNYKVFNQRAYLNGLEKLSILPATFYKSRTGR